MKKLPWYQNLQILAWSVGGLTAAGALIVGTARYINLPAQVEAGEQKNVQQDKQIDRLITLQEYYQQQQVPNQVSRPSAPQPVPQPIPNLPAPPQTPIRVYWEQTEDGEWFCTDGRESWWPNEQGDCE